jgi:[acyl-carrier-protein] S-malonyltransferase
MDFTAVLFPGQGSLTADARDHALDVVPDLVERASELVGEDPFDRPQESTRFAQPAIFVASMAGWRERQDALSDVGAMAGHSLGELSALAAAGALRTDDALKLVVLRGRLMADAAAENPGGGMVALLGATPERAAELAAEHGLEVANDNAPGQVVLSGRRARIDAVIQAARDEGLKAMTLDVAGAFHSRDMSAAELPFLLALEDVPMSRPHVPVISGYAGRPFADVQLELARALVRPVRWREVMAALVGMGARRFVDVGPGEVLARLVKRNVRIEQGDVVHA